MEVSELTGADLDYWVAKALGYKTSSKASGGEILYIDSTRDACVFKTTTGKAPCEYHEEILDYSNWEQAGKLIEKYSIDVWLWIEDGTDIEYWGAQLQGAGFYGFKNNTATEAICRAVVASVYGEEVEDE